MQKGASGVLLCPLTAVMQTVRTRKNVMKISASKMLYRFPPDCMAVKAAPDALSNCD